MSPVITLLLLAFQDHFSLLVSEMSYINIGAQNDLFLKKDLAKQKSCKLNMAESQTILL